MLQKKHIYAMVMVIGIAAFGLGFSWLAGASGMYYRGHSVFFLCATLAFALNWAAFVPSSIAQTEKFYDLTGAATYISTILVACFLSAPLDFRAALVAVLVVIWSMRLGSFLFLRIRHAGGRDRRFDHIKISPPRFLIAWTLQALWVVITASSAFAVISTPHCEPPGVFLWCGLLLWLLGFAFEAIADRQKKKFMESTENHGKFIRTGLWAYSQHPNYFGEITLWLGIAVIAFPVLAGWSFLVLLSPVFVAVLLTRVSGINLLDRAAMAKWGDDPAYLDYRRTTPVLVPRLWPIGGAR